MEKKVIVSEKSPAAIGPYSQAIEYNGIVYTSGVIGVNPATGEVVKGGITEQTKQSFKNLLSILDEMGMSEEDVQKVNVYLTDMKNFDAMNVVYEQQFSAPYPTRTTVGVTGLCGDALIEIELIAKK